MFEAEHVNVAAHFRGAMRTQDASRLSRLTNEQLVKLKALYGEVRAIFVEAQGGQPYPALVESDADSTVPFAKVGRGVPLKSGWASFQKPVDNARGKVPMVDLDELSKIMPPPTENPNGAHLGEFRRSRRFPRL
jgi:hypothetical protein